jgi:hypothetical protein
MNKFEYNVTIIIQDTRYVIHKTIRSMYLLLVASLLSWRRDLVPGYPQEVANSQSFKMSSEQVGEQVAQMRLTIWVETLPSLLL